MNNKIDNYRNEINAEVELLREEFPVPAMAFTAFMVKSISDLTNVNEYQIAHCIKLDAAGRNKGEIYGYGMSANGEVLTLYYPIYEPLVKSAQSVQKTDFDTAVNRLQGFYNLCIRGLHMDFKKGDIEYEVGKFIYDNLSSIMSVRLCVLSNCVIKDYPIKDIRIDGKNVSIDIWDITKTYANLHSGIDHISIDIDFENEKRYSMYHLPYIEMNSERCQYKCISTMFPAKLLYKLYERHNTDLLLNNVRFFLDFKTGRNDVNSGMRRTLKNENEKFLAYNNGITAIARDIIVESNNDRTNMEQEDGIVNNDYISTGIIKKIIDFQIVNGGQTTASIFTAKKKEPKDISLLGVYVMVKLIVLQSKDPEMITNISTFTNSQNKVKFADFSSSSPFNKEMESLSRNIMAPNPNNKPLYWFFERIRGQYRLEMKNNTTKIAIESFKSRYPIKQKFDKELLAKVKMAWDQHPSDAVKGSSTTYQAFLKTIDNSKYIPDDTYFKNCIALLIIYNFLISREETKKYGNGKAPVVIYTLAYLNYFTGGNLNLMKIWLNQSLSPELKTFLNKLSERMYEELLSQAELLNTTILSVSKKNTLFASIRNGNLFCDLTSIHDDLIP